MKHRLHNILLTSAVFVILIPFGYAQGVMLRGVGAANEGVGSVATAMPISAGGAINWNPASISAFEKNVIEFGAELIQPHTRASTAAASTKGEAGVTPVPSMAFVWRRSPHSVLTYGIGMAGVGGASSLYSPHAANPAVGVTGRSANVVVMQITPTIAAQVTERWSLGISPVIDLATVNINPMGLGGGATTPLTTYGTKYAWAGGFQIGSFYDHKNHFKTGFMFKSPIWAEDLYFSGLQAPNTPASRSFDMNLPMTLSAGFSYDGFKDTIIGADFRYLDYGHTAGFKEGLVGTTVAGLGWESVFAVAVGAEHSFTNKFKGRIGYCWNENPIPPRSSALNVAAPLMIQHVLSFGAGYTFAKDLEVSLCYCHAFKASVTGGGVTNEVSADTGGAGITKRW
ncbi:MAG: outer membrane protein transport protein [Planctomycetaceae bacterium]|jgi:long-chain fatty acid transport protein|nr:outer membrane protein transport protein [Planctomycetaceae bacterium]